MVSGSKFGSGRACLALYLTLITFTAFFSLVTFPQLAQSQAQINDNQTIEGLLGENENSATTNTLENTLAVIDNSSAVGTSSAMIVIDNLDTASRWQTIRLIRSRGGRIWSIFPPYILIGQAPDISDLIGKAGILEVYRTAVDPSAFEKYGGSAALAAWVWNCNYMGIVPASLTQGPGEQNPQPIVNDALISPLHPRLE